MIELLSGEGDPFGRSRFEPGHFTASAFIASPGLDSMLLIFHPRLGRWLQPGGHVEPGDEDLLMTARREVEEETGFGVDELAVEPAGVFDLDIHPIPATESEPAHLHYDVRFRFRAGAGGGPARTGDHELRWFPTAPARRSTDDPSVTRVLDKWFGGRDGDRKETK